MSNGIGERIAALLADRRETQADLARALDVKRQSVNKWMSGRSDPRKDIVAKIAEYFQVSPAWLAYGSEPGAYGDSIHLESGDVVIPVYDSEFSCGPGSEHSEFPQTARFMVVTPEWLGRYAGSANRNSLALFPCVGDSMAPTIGDGDLAIIDSSQTRIVGDAIYALSYSGSFFIKRVQVLPGKIIVKSDNPGYSPFEVSGPDLDNIKVLGRVYVVMNIHKP